jgi:hypothetical protein
MEQRRKAKPVMKTGQSSKQTEKNPTGVKVKAALKAGSYVRSRN